MRINITRDKYLEEIKQEFNKAFPYLKIDFKIPEKIASKDFRNKIQFPLLRVGDLINDNPEGAITINENNSIKQIAQKFAEHFGLTPNFYRKSGNLWLEIKMTGDWSLKQQNESGMEVY